MEDSKILDLYWQRSEEAIAQTDAAHGKKLHNLSYRIVASYEDAQECVSDTYFQAWQTIPPQRPTYFFAYLAKICRFLSFGKLDWRNATKRKADIVQLTAEMGLCIPDNCMEAHMENAFLGQLLNSFLDTLSRDNRIIFVRRYWFTDSVREIAQRYGMTESKVKTQLHRTRCKLKAYLQKEGITV